VSRRRLLAASGVTLAAGAPAVLAACGAEEDEDVSPEREAELLNDVLTQQLAVIDAADQASSNAPRDLQEIFDRLRTIREQSARALENTIRDQDGTPTSEAAAAAGGESPTEGVARQLEQSIAGSLAAIGELTPETRLPVHQAIVEDAETLAAIRDTLGEDIAPDAFVMGAPEEKEAA
jgi:hypothetical protein